MIDLDEIIVNYTVVLKNSQKEKKSYNLANYNKTLINQEIIFIYCVCMCVNWTVPHLTNELPLSKNVIIEM